MDMPENASPHARLDDFDPSLVGGYECDAHFLAEVHAVAECGEPVPEWYCQLKPNCGAKRRQACLAIKRRAAILATAPILMTLERQ